MAKTFVVYDARSAGGVGTDDAQVYCTADSLAEAKGDVRSMFPDGEIYEDDLNEHTVTNERWIPRNYDSQQPAWFE